MYPSLSLSISLSIYLSIYLSFLLNYDGSQQILAVGHYPPQTSAAGNCITLPASLHVSHVSLLAAAVRITAYVPFFPMATTRAEKPHASSLPSLPRRHIRHLRGVSSVSLLLHSTCRAGDAVRKDTQSEQARLSGNRSPTHMRWPTASITCTSQPAFC